MQMRRVRDTEGVPKYIQLAQILREKITRREYRAGDRIPSEAELGDTWKMSRITVRQALDRLVRDNFLERRQLDVLGDSLVSLTRRICISRRLLPKSDKLPHVAAAQNERGLSAVQGILERAVFRLDAGAALIADVGQRGNESSPLDIAQAGKLRSVELQRRCQDAHIVQPVPAHLCVFHVHVEDAVCKLVDGLHVIDCCHSRWDGSRLRPKLFDGISVNIVLQWRANVMFFPPATRPL